jgi:GPI ethanolamine phosphate transferase 3 subunit O
MDLYSRAHENWSASLITSSSETCSQEKVEKGSVLLQQIDAYNDFLKSFAKLARSAWTEFDLWSMGIGLLLMMLSVIIQASMLVNMTISQSSDQKSSGSSIIRRLSLAFSLVVIRAASFLSNSYICECCLMNQTYHIDFNLYIPVHSLFFLLRSGGR